MAITMKSLDAITRKYLPSSLERMRADMEAYMFMRRMMDRPGKMKLTPLGGIGSYQGMLIQFIPNLPPFPCGVYRYEKPGVIAR